VGVGTGLGLTICFQVIQEHGGEISIDSPQGEGTRVTIRLPINGPAKA
jgi:two-component system, NtrC family, sensor kinase